MKLTSATLVLLGTALCVTAQVPNLTPATPLLKAVIANDTAAAVQLLADGADPNEGRFAGIPPVAFAVLNQNLAVFRAFKEKGVDLNVRDASGGTLLMWAALDEAGRGELVEELLGLGLSPNSTDSNGNTALTWALRKGSDTPAVAALRRAGASNAPAVKAAIENSIALLQKSGPQFVKISGCVSCHHQALPQMAIGMARARGLAVDELVSQQQVKAVIGFFSPLRDEMNHGTARFPDVPVSFGYSLLGLSSENYPADETTAAMAYLVSTQQLPDGSFRTIPARPPIEASDLTATALGMRAMQLYGKGMQRQVQQAAAWLQAAAPQSTEDRAMQLLGLKWANLPFTQLKKPAAALVALQHEDGGWSQLPGLSSDAYATGQALVALQSAGMSFASDAVFQRGVDFLLRTQLPDGSWLVRSRTYPVQPYKDSGYPHGHDQWISAAGSSWASMALSLSIPVPRANSRSIPLF